MKNQLYWTNFERTSFRFAFIFILSFILLKNNGAYPFFVLISKPFVDIFKDLTPWFAKNILNYKYDYSIFTNGSGDTSYDWVSVIILLLITILGCTIWSLLDKKRTNYNTLYYYLTVFVRYYIAFMLINYGVIKLIHAQMPPPTLSRLMQPLHEFSPMGLAWTFLGFSKGYNIFMGIAEIMAVLLLFRRTVVLGALVTLATSINIMTVNYFFDVPVKLVSTALFLFSLFLLIPHIKSLYFFFIGGQTAELKRLHKPTFNKKWKNKLILGVKILIISFFTLTQLSTLANRQKMISFYYKKSSLNGIFKIDRQGKSIKTIPSDWNYIIFENEGMAQVRDINYEASYKDFTLNEKTKEITINNFKLKYAIQENGDIILTKTFPTGTEEVILIKQKKENMELIKRGFNLIQEYPYNR